MSPLLLYPVKLVLGKCTNVLSRAKRGCAKDRVRDGRGRFQGVVRQRQARQHTRWGTVMVIASKGSPGVPEYCDGQERRAVMMGLSSILLELKKMSLVQRDKIVGLSGENASVYDVCS